jgi:hypothetical protein
MHKRLLRDSPFYANILELCHSRYPVNLNPKRRIAKEPKKKPIPRTGRKRLTTANNK